MIRITLFTIILGLIFFGCRSDEADSSVAHEHHVDGKSVTVWSENYEVFMEYEVESLNQPIGFLIHVTNLENFSPFENELSVELKFANFNKSLPNIKKLRAGIYETEIAFPSDGEYEMILALTGKFPESITITNIEIQTAHEEDEDSEHHEDEGGISFLKEQQWKTKFATHEVELRNLSHSVQASGEIISKLDGDVIVSAPFTGMILPDHNPKLPKVGDYIKKGEIVTVMTPSAEGESEQNFAGTYIQRESELKLTKIELERAQRLFEKDAIPKKELQAAEAKYEEAKANFGSLTAFVEKFQMKTSDGKDHPDLDFIIRAPISGFIEEIYFHPGEEVQSGNGILRIIDNNVVWMKINVPISEVTKITKTNRVSFRIHGMENNFLVDSDNGKVISLGNLISPESRTFPVIYEIINRERTLKIGMFADVRIYNGSEKLCKTIPENALIEDEGNYYVFVQVEGEKFERRDVVLGIKDSGMVEIISGIEQGERVVTDGSYQVKLASQVSGLPEHGHVH